MFGRKIFSQTHSNKAGIGFLKIPKALSNRVFNNGYSKHFQDMTSGTKLKKMIKEHVWKKNFYSNAFGIRQESDLKIPKALSNRVFP